MFVDLRARALSCCLLAILVAGLVTPAYASAAGPGPGEVGVAGLNGVIAFSGMGPQGSDGSDIFTIFPDGTNLKNLTNSGLHAAAPTWSPDGRVLLYSTATDLVLKRGFAAARPGSRHK